MSLHREINNKTHEGKFLLLNSVLHKEELNALFSRHKLVMYASMLVYVDLATSYPGSGSL